MTSRTNKSILSHKSILPDKEYSRESFEIVDSLGKGAYGTVLLVRDVEGTGGLFAMKELNKDTIRERGKI